MLRPSIQPLFIQVTAISKLLFTPPKYVFGFIKYQFWPKTCWMTERTYRKFLSVRIINICLVIQLPKLMHIVLLICSLHAIFVTCSVFSICVGHINNQYNTCFWMLVKSGKTTREAQSKLKVPNFLLQFLCIYLELFFFFFFFLF